MPEFLNHEALAIAADVASWLCFLAGGAFLLIGATGLIRLPDFWSRLHAAGIIDTMGAELILVGMMFQAGLTQVTVKLVLIGLFLFVTSPTSTHALANAVWVAGLMPLGMKKNESDQVMPEEKP